METRAATSCVLRMFFHKDSGVRSGTSPVIGQGPSLANHMVLCLKTVKEVMRLCFSDGFSLIFECTKTSVCTILMFSPRSQTVASYLDFQPILILIGGRGGQPLMQGPEFYPLSSLLLPRCDFCLSRRRLRTRGHRRMTYSASQRICVMRHGGWGGEMALPRAQIDSTLLKKDTHTWVHIHTCTHPPQSIYSHISLSHTHTHTPSLSSTSDEKQS